jgi:serine protein kinase
MSIDETDDFPVKSILEQSEAEVAKLDWEGTFSDYLGMVVEDPSISRLSHSLVYDAVLSHGVNFTPEGQPVYGLFEDKIFGLDDDIHRIVQYLGSAAQRLEVRKRILLLLGPPASGKSSVVDLIKRALEQYTRTVKGAVYAISGCPMQEEPLHLIPERFRNLLNDRYGVYVEGDLCPRCRYMLRTDYEGRISEMPVSRVTFDEKEAVGVGYYVATNPNPTDSSLLVGSVDLSKLGGDRQEVLGKAFRLDGELNIANRGLMEFVEMFKADRHMLTALLGLAQEQLIKLDRFGSVYADEVIVGHSNEGDFDTFASEKHAEALKDRIIAIQVPYALKVSEEIKIYEKMIEGGSQLDVHLAPLTLRVASTYTVLSRIDPSSKQAVSLLDKVRSYDGEAVASISRKYLKEMRRHHSNEGMFGISPRYMMNRLGAVAGSSGTVCVSPLAALDSLWQGLSENVSLDPEDRIKYVNFVTEAVKEYDRLAVRDVQRAFEESFEQTAEMLLSGYLDNITPPPQNDSGHRTSMGDDVVSERDIREIERAIGIAEREKETFRSEIGEIVLSWRKRGKTFKYTSEPRLRTAIEARLFPSSRILERGLTKPRFAKQRAEWAQRRSSIARRLVDKYGYCEICSEDVIDYVTAVLKKQAIHKTPKNEGIEWMWPLNTGANTSTS